MELLHSRAVRTPLPDEDAERAFHRNMLAVADGRERKADLLADPDVSVLDAYEEELARVAETFRRHLRNVVGEDYEAVARAYRQDERDDRRGALATYYLEGLWRIQQRSTVSDMLFFPLILRYPDSFTINLRFASCHTTTESVHYESPQHCSKELAGQHAEKYHDECLYEQTQAASYLRETAAIIREEFPHPDKTPFEERKYGGIVSGGGRRKSEFTVMLERVEPDQDRFEASIDQPTLVPAGEEARRTAENLLPGDQFVL